MTTCPECGPQGNTGYVTLLFGRERRTTCNSDESKPPVHFYVAKSDGACTITLPAVDVGQAPLYWKRGDPLPEGA